MQGASDKMSLSEVAHPGSPGIYRRISDTQDLLFNDVNSLTNRINQELQLQQQELKSKQQAKKALSLNTTASPALSSPIRSTASLKSPNHLHVKSSTTASPVSSTFDHTDVSHGTNGDCTNNQNSHGSNCSSNCNHVSTPTSKDGKKEGTGSRRGSSTLKLSTLINHDILRRAFSSNYEKDSSNISHTRKNSSRKGSRECSSPPSPLTKTPLQGNSCSITATPDSVHGSTAAAASALLQSTGSSRLHLHQSPESIRGTTLAAKMASEVVQQQGWPNSKDDYELGEVIGK